MNEEKYVTIYLRSLSDMTKKDIDKLFEILEIDKDCINIDDVLAIKFLRAG